MKLKVCMLVANHPFLDARIFKKEAKSLLKRGYDVTLVVPRKNGYLFDIDGSPFTDRFLEPSFLYEGIKIVTYHEQKESFAQRYSNVKSNKTGSFQNELTKTGLAQKADIYHAHEFSSLYSAVGIKRALSAEGMKVKLIYDSHEISPDPLSVQNSANKKKLLRMLDRMIKEVDYIITVSDAIKNWYIIRNPNIPVEVIYNSPPFAQDHHIKLFDDNGLTVCHEGNITRYKGNAELIFGIVFQCSKSMPFTFKIIGGTRQGKTLPVPSRISRYIKQTGWVEYHEIPEHMKDADIGWLHLDTSNSLNRTFALPNKFFSYLNNGIPVVVNKCCEMERIIRTHHCGLVINKTNPTVEDYAEAFEYMNRNRTRLQKMSVNARNAMKNWYCWEHMEKRLFLVYEHLSMARKKYFI
ncbi:glycosyltransferase [Paenibacillus gansuensis]|uniref:Glycosyltransferase n=1 Tax=Paenibacillus gansuensis TaxID=306542 RepID=A0ABW5PJ92_9BACL